MEAEAQHRDFRKADTGCWFHWTRGEGRTKYASNPTFQKMMEEHTKFHQEAGRVAATINAAKYAEATGMLAPGSAFAKASQSCVLAIVSLKRGL
jgi:hypothetical protein